MTKSSGFIFGLVGGLVILVSAWALLRGFQGEESLVRTQAQPLVRPGAPGARSPAAPRPPAAARDTLPNRYSVTAGELADTITKVFQTQE